VASADVLLVSLPKPQLEKLGLAWEQLKARQPNLVFVHVSPSGYGKGGWHGLGAEFYPFYAGSAGILDAVRANARVPMEEDDAPAPQFVPLFGEHVVSLQVVVAAAGALFHKQQKGPGQKVEVIYEYFPQFFNGNGMMTLDHVFRVNGTDLDDMDDRFPFKSLGLDKNALRTQGGMLIPSFQAYECQDGKWIQLLELDLIGPLSKMHDALDDSTTGKTKRAAAWNAIFNRLGVVDRLLVYINTFREEFVELAKQFPREELARRFDEADLRYILVGDALQATQHQQVVHLGLVQPDRVRCPVTLHGTTRSNSMRAPRLGEHNFLLGAQPRVLGSSTPEKAPLDRVAHLP
jgi:crotonobetainyl-CoA:carnitine CoA-transferase CaiB-like acyl-CoA transferase